LFSVPFFRCQLSYDVSFQIARYAAYSATGETSEAIERHLEAYPDVDGVVMGDEARLRQVITNLAR
jgi:hypothetical protein